MSDFSLTLVLQFKTSKIINGMAKVQIKSERITPFGGIFQVRELFSRFVGPVIDKVLGLRCTSFGYQYGEIAGSLASVYLYIQKTWVLASACSTSWPTTAILENKQRNIPRWSIFYKLCQMNRVG